MADELAALKDQNTAIIASNVDLMRENDFLRSEVTKLRSERDRLQAYSIDLTTRLDVVVETANNAKSEARKFAIKPVVPDNQLEQAGPEQQAAREIVASLPRRLPTNAFQ